MTTDCIIGLDISTSCTGIAALDESGNVLAMVEHKPKGETLVEKAADFKRSLLEFVSNNILSLQTNRVSKIFSNNYIV